jgi:predicted SnoaL-like aldol condensation-catalyzing enzyme
MTNLPARKDAAVDFLQMVVAGKIPEAYKKYVDMRGRHHNPFFPAGFSELEDAMMQDETRHPGKQLRVKNVLGDGDLVAVHSHLVIRPGETEMAVVHIFRFAGERIVEMWDCGQILPADSPNGDGTF